jgi:cytochrome b561
LPGIPGDWRVTVPASSIRWRDGRSYFGWISIILHWTGAIVVLALLFIGNSIHAAGLDGDTVLALHTSIALSAMGLLWFRVLWRVMKRHPDRLPTQNKAYYAIGKPFHYILVGAIAMMLTTGPLVAWSGGLPLRFWVVEIPSPFAQNPSLFHLVLGAHIAGATVLGWGTLLHVVAVIKHAAIDRDGAFDRMMAPPRDAAVAQRADNQAG